MKALKYSILLIFLVSCRFPGLDNTLLEYTTLQGILRVLGFGSELSIGGETRNLLGENLRLQLDATNSNNNEVIQEELSLTGSSFTFRTRLPSDSTYSISITNQPTNPTQICELAGANGTLSQNVDSVLVQCGVSLDVAQPIFSPPAGSFPSAVNVSINTSTSGANIFYTTDGSDPNCTGLGIAYTIPINVPQPSLAGIEIRAIACKDNLSSSLQIGNYIVTNGQIPIPTSSLATNPPAPNYTVAQNTTLAIGGGSPGGTIVHYTTDGSTPTCSSPSTPNPVPINNSMTLRAISCLTNWTPSVITDFNYTIVGTVATPILGTATGTYNNDINLSITTTTPGASIHYTINQGGAPATPTCASTIYSAPILINEDNTQISAIACLAGWTDSAPTAIFVYNFNAAVPTLLPAPIAIQTSQTVTASSTTAGSSIHYTTDGSLPTCASSTTAPNLVAPSDGTENVVIIRSIACKTGYLASSDVTGNYSLTGTLAPPIISPIAGTYPTAQNVSINLGSNNPVGTSIHFTTDSSNPTCASSTYSGPINVAASQEIRAIACRNTPLWTSSSVAIANYTITGTVANPSFSSPPGTFNNDQTITMSSATPGATVYWFSNIGSPATTPSCGSGNTGTISIIQDNTHVAAIACLAGWTDSGVVTGIYNLVAITPTPDVTAGTYGTGQTITFTSTTIGSDIRINSGLTPPDPTCADAVQSSINLPNASGLVVIKAISCKTNYQSSTVFTGNYIIGQPVPQPNLSVDTNQIVNITAVTPPASQTRCYTTNGTDPLCSPSNGGAPGTLGNFCAAGSTPFTAPFQITTTTDFRARSCSTGNLQSPVAQQNITILGTVGAVSITPGTGTYNNTPNITMSAISSSSIYYRIDGVNPDCSGTGATLYSGAFPLNPTSANMEIRAIGCNTNYVPSGVATNNYTFTVASPTISLLPGTYNSIQSGVTITSSTIGSSIFYTVDGTTPNCVAGGSTIAYSGAMDFPTDTNLLSLGGAIDNRFQISACKANYNVATVNPATYNFQVSPIQVKFGDIVFINEATINRSGTVGPVSISTLTNTTSSTICRSTASGINCNLSGICQAPSITMSAPVIGDTPGLTNYFRACKAGFQPSAEKTMTLTIPDPITNFSPRFFVSQQVVPGNTSFLQADEICNTDPNRPFQEPAANYQAFRMETNRIITSNWVLEPNTNYYNVYGDVLGLTPPGADSLNTNMPFALSNQLNPSGAGDVWTGININGSQRFAVSGINCSDWSSTAGNGGIGNSSLTNSQFVNTTQAACSATRRLYCVERDYRKRVFVTQNLYNGNLGGVTGADQKCNSDPLKPPTGYYKAMLGIPGVRDWNGGAPIDWPLRPSRTYYRADRSLPVYTTNTQSSIPGSSITNTLDATPLLLYWTGFFPWVTTIATNCNNWTSGSALDSARIGSSSFTVQGSHAWNTNNCITPNRLICVEQ